MKRLQTKPKVTSKARKDSTDSSSDEAVSNKSSKIKSSAMTKPTKKAVNSFLSLESSMNNKLYHVYNDDTFICIRDKFPKAKCHLLLIPLAKYTKVEDLIRLPNATDFLKLLLNTANKIVDKLPESIDKTKLNYGFHSIQSMYPLHMHIISTDFQSDCLKNKKHWNSFNTSYFIHLKDLIKHMEKESDYFAAGDKFNLKDKSLLESFLKMDLKCNHCGQVQSNMPNLKKHLLTHK